MRRLLLCLLAALPLAGCAGAQNFSCAPEGGQFRLDVDQYTRPATTAGTGYLHC